MSVAYGLPVPSPYVWDSPLSYIALNPAVPLFLLPWVCFMRFFGCEIIWRHKINHVIGYIVYVNKHFSGGLK
jgi:hypothetical protein